ncbi:MAG: MFS transporter [Candidatus Omnitrophica bacterium]|nr:MFS transporter [Candidatus Omnitrophota bacterium]
MLDKSTARLASLVYFVQGALGITAVALPLYLKHLGFSITQIAYLSSFSAFPWFLKIIYGAISDSLPIFGLRRKPYLVISSLIAASGWLILALKPTGFYSLLAILSLVNVGFAATDVITDGLIVEKSDKETVGKYQSLCWGFRSLGSIISGIGGGLLARALPYHEVFAIAALLPFITMIFSIFIHEEKPVEKEKLIWEPIWRSLKLLVGNQILIFSFVLIIVAFSASFGTPYFFYLKEQLKFSEDSLGLLTSISWMGTILGAYIYGKFLSQINLATLMLIGIIINLINTLACLWVFNFTSAAIIFSISGVFAYITFLPLLSACAKLTHGTGVEGCLFAVLMSIHNFGNILSGIIGGAIYPQIGLTALIIGTGILGLTAIPFILKLKSLA